MADDEKASPLITSPKRKINEKSVVDAVKKRCVIRSRKYTLRDLNELRHLESYRLMPTDLEYNGSELISLGLGLKIHAKSSLSKQIKNRNKQIITAQQSIIGYKNYIRLIPKQDRLNIHPFTPTRDEIISFPKRRFEAKIKKWKKDLHSFDNINNITDMPYHLLTNRMKIIRSQTSLSTNNTNNKIWSPKHKTLNTNSKNNKISSITSKSAVKSAPVSSNQKPVYSPTRHRWFKPKSVASNGNFKRSYTKSDNIDDAANIKKKLILSDDHQINDENFNNNYNNIISTDSENENIGNNNNTNTSFAKKLIFYNDNQMINDQIYDSGDIKTKNTNNNKIITTSQALECLQNTIKHLKKKNINNIDNALLLKEFNKRISDTQQTSNCLIDL